MNLGLPEHISYSQVKMFLDCPEKYRLLYIEQIERKESEALVFGKAYHQALEVALNSKMRGEEITSAALGQAAEYAWGEVMDEAECALSIEDEDEAVDNLRELVTLYWNTYSRSILPTAVEWRFSIPIPGVDVPFVGVIDLVDNGFLVDHKTANKSWYQGRADSDMQATAYTYAYWAMRGEFPLGFRFDIAVKGKTPKVMQLDTARTKNQVLWFERLLPKFWRAVKAGIFVPNPTGFLCNKRYCDGWDRCMG